MTFNPSVELYVVSRTAMLADAAPPGHIQRQKIDLAPVQTFSAAPPAGVWRRSAQSKQKVFSAAPLRQDGELRGYLYIILQGEESNALAEMPGIKRCGALCCGRCCWWRCLACWRAAGLVLGDAPGKQLTRGAGLEQDSISAIKQLAAQPPERRQ
jgi:hypothetical protein